MPKPLIIAEKPSAARAIADALGGFARREGYFENDQYYLSWAVGHLVELMSPEEYESRWKRWSLASLPILPSIFGLKVINKTRSQFSVLTRLAAHASELINGCDAGREGELIFRYICEAGNLRLPARRLWVSALTRDAIRRAFGEMEPEAAYERLYQSARCRAQGDWLVGMNATRAFTVKWGELLSVGRVQTPTLALLVRREREIAAFVPEAYWEVTASFETTVSGRRAAVTYLGKWFGPDGDRLKSQAEAEAILSRVEGKDGAVERVAEKAVAEKPPQLYDLTTLQREANRRYGLTAAAALKAAQSLYEDKLITYPRTDSRYLNRDLVRTLPAVVKAAETQAEYRTAAAGADLRLVHPGNFRVVNDAKVTDHHAIIPTTETARTLSGAEGKIYGLIMRRFLAQFYPEARFVETEVTTRVGDLPDRFRSRGRRMLEPGWRVVEPEPARKKGEEGEEPTVLPALTEGQPVTTREAEVTPKETQPPKRLTEATLLSAMEFAGRELDDEALKEAMKGRGLGTPATRASIIERLKEVGYITAEKKSLLPTDKGVRLVELAECAGAQVLLSAELTGEWERRIAEIQGGTDEPERFLSDIRVMASVVVEQVRLAAGGPATGGSAAAAPAAGEVPAFAGKCPRCGRSVIRGKRDWVCANGDCTLRIPGWLCGKAVDGPLAATLLAKGRSKLITGFRSPRTGKTFSAYLVLQADKVVFEFPVDKPKKASGFRRNPEKGAQESDERAAAKKTGSRQTSGHTTRSTAGSKRSGVGRGTSRASKPAGTAPQPD